MALEVEKLIAEDDWMTKPATKGDVMLVKHDLENRMDQLEGSLNGRMDQLEGSLNGRMDQLEGSLNGRMDQLEGGLNGRMDRLETTLNSRIEVEIAKIEVQIAGLHRAFGRTVWIALAILGAVGILLRFF